MSNNDDFADIRGEVERMGFGSLAGDGVDSHNSVKTTIGAEGAENRLRCDRCGKGLQVVIPWTELVYMSQGVLPPNGSWRHDGYNGCFLPNLKCVCHEDVRLGVTPDECAKHLKGGIAAGRVRPGDVAQLAGQIQQQINARR